MKKLKSLLVILAVFFMAPLITNAESANVVIDGVTLENASEGAIENSAPTFNGLDLNFDVKFTNVGDSVVYKVNVTNKDQEDYTLSNSKVMDGEYIEYEFSFEDSTNILKANSSKVMKVRIKYAKAVPESALTNGKYTKASNVKISFNDKAGNAVPASANPKTGNSMLLILMLLAIVIAGVSLVLFRNKKGVKTLSLLVALGLFAVPTTIFAIKALTINVNANIEVSNLPKFCIFDFRGYDQDNASIDNLSNYYLEADYIDGMTFEQYLGKFTDTIISPNTNVRLFFTYEDLRSSLENEGSDVTGTEVLPSTVIQDKSHGCYLFELKD